MALFTASFTPLRPGSYRLDFRADGQTGVLSYTVAAAPVITTSKVIEVNPLPVSPASGLWVEATPQLCWTLAASAGQPPYAFRVLLAGDAAVDSGWLSQTCWQPPRLGRGVYWWKVLVRDARGYLNRTNQRPYLFRLR
jgi:hypothetical protein